MSRKPRLELTWIGKDQRPKLEPRILIEEPGFSHHAAARREGDIFDNMLIQGDNLLAIKALEADYAGKVKCVFIDPPYNTGSAFAHYDDGIEHSIWLSLMRDRLEIMLRLLAEDGSLWITIDDNEAHYLKVLCDELFGRANFVASVVWQKKYAPSNDSIWLSDTHDYILIYAKSKLVWRPNSLLRKNSSDALYKNIDNDPRGNWLSDNYTCNKNAEERPNLYYTITNPFSGQDVWPKRTAVWRYSRETHLQHVAENMIWWGIDGKNSVPRFKRFKPDESKGRVPETIWLWEEVGHNQDAKREQMLLFPDAPFSTPKPEALLSQLLNIATNPGDLVLDSFAGSGTTGAVAHKMGRRWIMVELGDHAVTHIAPRLKKVIDREDKGGITETVGWQGGGGFRFYRLAPSLLEKDRYRNWIISKKYNLAMLSEAVCKLMGFTYAPAQEPGEYWRHGHSTESDFIYVTTQSLTHATLKKFSDEVGPKRTLLICCKAYNSKEGAFDNLTIRKIPLAVLTKCEWSRDDYSLRLSNLPQAAEMAEPAPQSPPANGAERKKSSSARLRGAQKDADQPMLALGGVDGDET